jgi:hypothetical protein
MASSFVAKDTAARRRSPIEPAWTPGRVSFRFPSFGPLPCHVEQMSTAALASEQASVGQDARNGPGDLNGIATGHDNREGAIYTIKA